MSHEPNSDDADGPSLEDLAAIEAEWPLIAAELDELDWVIRIISAGHPPSDLDVRHYRRVQRRVLREMRAYLGFAPVPGDDHAEVA